MLLKYLIAERYGIYAKAIADISHKTYYFQCRIKAGTVFIKLFLIYELINISLKTV